jgi:hypothetical protein
MPTPPGVMDDIDEDPPASLTGDALTRWFDKRNRRAIRGLFQGQADLSFKVNLGISIIKWAAGIISGILVGILGVLLVR